MEGQIVLDTEIVCETKVVDIDTQFATIQQTLTKFKTYVSEIQQQMRMLEKSIKTIKKEAGKGEAGHKGEAIGKVMRQPKIIGFDIPEKITPELCAFMKLSPESTATRNAVTFYITEYIRQHKLQDMTDRKRIGLNEELATLFKLTESKLTESKLTYYNLHKHISAHII